MQRVQNLNVIARVPAFTGFTSSVYLGHPRIVFNERTVHTLLLAYEYSTHFNAEESPIVTG